MLLVRSKIHLLYPLFLVLFAPVVVSGQGTTITLQPEADRITVNAPLCLPDSTEDLGIDQVSDPAMEREFVKPDALTEGIAGDVYWITFELANPDDSPANWVLEFDDWLYVDMYYKKQKADTFKHTITGHFVPYKERDYPMANRNLISLNIESGERVLCYVRLETGWDYMTRPTNFEFGLAQVQPLLERESTKKAIISIFLGVYFVMFLYNFFLYLSTKDVSFRYYLIMLVIMSAIVLHNFGYLHPLFKFIDSYPKYDGHFDIFISAALGVTLFFFARNFLHLKENLPKGNKVLKILTVIVLLMPIPSLFGQVFINYGISSLLGIISLLTVITIGIMAYRRGVPSAIYFVIAYGAFIVGIVVFLAGEIGGFWSSDFSPFIVQFGSGAEMILFSFALGDRINVLRRDNEAKQEQIIKQLQENQALQTKVNRELEQKVRERTLEIEQQKEELAVEKDRSEKLLLNILPSSTAEELKEKGHATSREYTDVTVLFTDFKGFTKLAEQISAEELVKDLDYCFKAFDDITEKYGLEKIKTIGDSYMCASGVPEPKASHAIDAVRAALEMEHFIAKWKEERKAVGKPFWEIRIGLHSGEVIAGVVGRKKFAFDIWGDTVNIASRMESGGEVGLINISQDTYDLVKDEFKCEYRGKFQAKNKGAIDMYKVIGQHSLVS